jgi:hypothetical protein
MEVLTSGISSPHEIPTGASALACWCGHREGV